MEQLRPVSNWKDHVPHYLQFIIICLILPTAVPLVGMLMLGNLMKESGVVDRINKTAGNELMNIITIFLGVSVGCTTNAETFLNKNTLFIVALGLIAFCFGTAGGVLSGKNHALGDAWQGESAGSVLPVRLLFRWSASQPEGRPAGKTPRISCLCTPWG